LDIKKNLEHVTDIFDVMTEKILKITRFWDLYRLSLPGRISVVKTLILPQINYLGCILEPDPPSFKKMEKIIEKFVLKSLNVATSRLYIPPNKGGLGLIRLSSYLKAQKCSLIKRAHFKCIDKWRVDLKTLILDGDLTKIRMSDVEKEAHPILFGFISSFTDLISSHSKINGNYREAFVFENPAFTYGEDNRIIDKTLFGHEFFADYSTKIRCFRLIDCYTDENFKTLDEFANFGLPINQLAWLKLNGSMTKAKTQYKKNMEDEDKKCETMHTYLTKIKKGSKKIRNTLESIAINQSKPTELQTVKTFARITGTTVPDPDPLGLALGFWNTHYLTNDFREFLFKERNNTLGVGARVAHFDQDADE